MSVEVSTQSPEWSARGMRPGASRDADHTVFLLWCRLTGTDPLQFGPDEREAFLARPQVAELAATPYEVLLDAGITAARRGSLPLERWLGAVQVVRPAGGIR